MAVRKALHHSSDKQGLNIHGNERLQDIYRQLEALMEEEYRRGSQEATSRILRVVNVNDLQETDVTLTRHTKSINRAPHGASRQFVEKALASGPKTIREIQETAKTGVEKLLSYQTIRLELERGKRERRYKKSNKAWSLY